jgi:histidinol-phosphate aminotransferase
MGVESLARPEIVAMKPYSSARKEAPGNGVLLNANEAPRPLLEEPGSLNRYPDPQPLELVSRLAKLYGVAQGTMLVTRGSDEGIDLLTRVFCRAGQDAILQCPPTFGMYRIAAQTQGADIVSVTRKTDDGFGLDEQAVLRSLAQDDRIKLVFLTSPNNPTGDVIGSDFLRQLLQATKNRSMVVLDEAYAEFCKQPSASAMIAEYENLVVLRTMSKAWAAAGLRCGAVLAQTTVIALLRRIIAPYPLPSPVVSLALRLLEADVLEKQKQLLHELRNNKQILLGALAPLSFIREIFPGEANFVLIRVDEAEELLTFCAARGIIIRGFPADPLLQGCIRISVGSEDDIAMLASALEEWEKSR